MALPKIPILDEVSIESLVMSFNCNGGNECAIDLPRKSVYSCSGVFLLKMYEGLKINFSLKILNYR